MSQHTNKKTKKKIEKYQLKQDTDTYAPQTLPVIFGMNGLISVTNFSTMFVFIQSFCC